MKRMLINATQQEELRVAQVDGQLLFDLDIERPGREQKKSNIYKGRIDKIQSSLQAAFVDIGTERHGFLPFKEIAREYFSRPLTDEELSHANIKDVLKEGQEIMVQIDKEERGNKGAALTSFVSLAGCYMVLMPNNPGAGGISRRIEGDERTDMREILTALNIPEEMGVIIRTAGVGKNKDELEWDLSVLISYWKAIKDAYATRPAPFLIHQESDIVTRAMRDHLRRDIGEILIDNADVYQRAQDYISRVRPDFTNKVKLYQDNVPLFTRFQIESQIESAFQRELRLPSGGAIVIDKTEALVSIDINSARSTRGEDIEETAFSTNLEASDEIARQLRLRDIGGLIVIDYIDMLQARHQREVENRLRQALESDRARVQVGRISRFGLLEMSRQRLRSSLEEASQQSCPRCNGQGMVRSFQSVALSILRLMEEEALKPKTAQIHAQLPLEVATFLLNEKRPMVTALEQRHKITILIIPNPQLEISQYKVVRVKADESLDPQKAASSYQLLHDTDVVPEKTSHSHASEAPAVKAVVLQQHPASKPKEDNNLIKRLWTSLFGGSSSSSSGTTKPATSSTTAETTTPQRSRSNNNQRNRNHKSRNRRSQRRRNGSNNRPDHHEHPKAASNERQPETKAVQKDLFIETEVKSVVTEAPASTPAAQGEPREPNRNHSRNRFHRRGSHHRRNKKARGNGNSESSNSPPPTAVGNEDGA